jgi:hypothetical protein
MKTLITRLTPNSNKWQKPSGPIGKCGRPKGPPYEGEMGFGWEEWLLNDFFNPDNQLEGFCYGFIQAFHKKNKAKSKIDQLHLYTRVCNGKRSSTFYLGYINNVEILAQPYTNSALIEKKEQFASKAGKDLVELKIAGFQPDLAELSESYNLFNVRFKKSDVHIADFDFEKREIKLPHGWYRFNLYDLNSSPQLMRQINVLNR